MYSHTTKFLLTTIDNNLIAIVETDTSTPKQRGEYLLSHSCVQKNVECGKFVDVTGQASGTGGGKLYVLAEDLG